MKKTLIFITFFLTANCTIYSQKIIKNFDVNMDGLKDKIEIDSISNIYIFNYLNQKRKSSKKIIFFKNFNSDAANIKMDMTNNILSFKVNYAPNYNDFDLVRFSYLKNKDDWYLLDIKTHRFNPLNKNFLTTECKITKGVKGKVSLLKNNFEMIQDLIESKKYGKTCRQFSEE